MFQNRNLGGFGSRVPMLDCAAGVKNKWIIVCWLFWKRFPFDRKQSGFAVFRLKVSVGIQSGSRHFSSSRGKRPLDAPFALNERVVQARVITETARGDFLPLFEGVIRL